MSLVPCKECGKEISDQAMSCPHCGIALSTVSGKIKHEQITNMSAVLLLLGLLGLAVVAFIGMVIFKSEVAGIFIFIIGGAFLLWLTTRKK